MPSPDQGNFTRPEQIGAGIFLLSALCHVIALFAPESAVATLETLSTNGMSFGAGFWFAAFTLK